MYLVKKMLLFLEENRLWSCFSRFAVGDQETRNCIEKSWNLSFGLRVVAYGLLVMVLFFVRQKCIVRYCTRYGCSSMTYS